MFVHERHRQIIDRLSRRPRVSVTQLQKEVRVSRSTLRRDLMELEESGEVIRVHGGVMHRDFLQGEPSFTKRGKQSIAQKRDLAEAAAAMVPENATVYLDAGTTCFEIGRRLLLRADVRIFTHSLRLAVDACVPDTRAALVLIGGEVRNVSQAVVGGLALDWMGHLRFDIGVVAASGIDASAASTTELSECALKQAILARSAKSILAADSSKWDRPAAVQFADLKQFHAWAVDRNVSADARRAAREAGVTVVTGKNPKATS